MSKLTLYLVGSLVGLIVLLIPAIPWLTGIFAEEQYVDFQSNLASEQNLTIKQQHYEKGWWSSTADSVLVIPGATDNLTLTHKVNHGLLPVVPVSIESIVNADGLVRNYTNRLFGDTGPLQLNTRLGPTGTGRTSLTLQAENDADPHRLTGTVDFSRGYVKGDFFSRHMQWGNPLNLEQVDWHVLFEQVGKDSRLSTLLQVMEAKILFEDETVDLNRFELDFTIESLSARIINFVLKHKTDYVRYAGAKYAPIVEVSAQNLDTHILGKFINALNRMPAYQRNMMLPMMVMQHSGNFLGHLPSLSIPRLEINTDGGSLKAKFHIDVKPFDKVKVKNIFQISQYLRASGECVAPDAVLHMIARNRIALELAKHDQTAINDSDLDKLTKEWLERELAEPLKNGYLVRTDNGYKTEFQLEDGIFRLNSQEMPLSDFMGMVF